MPHVRLSGTGYRSPQAATLFAFLWLFSGGAVIAAPVNVDAAGLALQGYDPVAYFRQEKAVKGKENLTATHEGATYRFSSAANKRRFEKEPGKYTPAYGGFCAYGMAQGYQAPVEPDQFTVVEGRLYLNFNAQVQEKWRQDISGYNRQADVAWEKFQQ